MIVTFNTLKLGDKFLSLRDNEAYQGKFIKTGPTSGENERGESIKLDEDDSVYYLKSSNPLKKDNGYKNPWRK